MLNDCLSAGFGILTVKTIGVNGRVLQSSLHFPLRPRCRHTAPRRGKDRTQPAGSARPGATAQSCALVFPPGCLLGPLGGAQGRGRSQIAWEPLGRTHPSPACTMLRAKSTGENSAIHSQGKCQVRPLYVFSKANMHQKCTCGMLLAA